MTDVRLDLPINSLISYHYFHDIDIDDMKSWGLRMIGDSGAFSAASLGAEIDRDKFYEWAQRWNESLYWTASLDVIGNEKASWDNWIARPSDVNLIPTVHYGCDPKIIDKYVEHGADLIGLGGMVPFKSEPKRLLRWCLQMMKYAQENHPGVRFHGWGVTHPDLVMQLPWWSVDSSGYASAYRYGSMMLIDPSKGKKIRVRLDGKEMAKHSSLLRIHYGVDWQKIAFSNSSTRRDVVRTALRSFQHLETFLQARWKVSCPRSLEDKHLRWENNSSEVGPNVHSVLGAPSMQPPKSISPHDMGPKIHAVLLNEHEFLDPRREK